MDYEDEVVSCSVTDTVHDNSSDIESDMIENETDKISPRAFDNLNSKFKKQTQNDCFNEIQFNF